MNNLRREDFATSCEQMLLYRIKIIASIYLDYQVFNENFVQSEATFVSPFTFHFDFLVRSISW